MADNPIVGQPWTAPGSDVARIVLVVFPVGDSTRVAFDDGTDYDIPPTADEASAIAAAALASAKALALARIEGRREVAFASGMATPFGRVQTDPLSVRNIQGKSSAAAIALFRGEPYSAEFRLEDNTQASMTGEQLIGLGELLDAHGSACYQRSWDLKDDVLAADTVEAVEAIDIDSGWPA